MIDGRGPPAGGYQLSSSGASSATSRIGWMGSSYHRSTRLLARVTKGCVRFFRASSRASYWVRDRVRSVVMVHDGRWSSTEVQTTHRASRPQRRHGLDGNGVER